MTERPGNSRIAAARAKASVAKATMLGAAALAFVWALVLARATHPGKTSGTSSARSSSAVDQVTSFDDEQDDSGSPALIAPAQATPQIATSSS